MKLKQSYLVRNVSLFFGVKHCSFKAKYFTCFFTVNDIFLNYSHVGVKETPLAWGLCFCKWHV